jgi:VanZ family protein
LKPDPAARFPLGPALLAYFLAVTLVITLAPFRFHVPGRFAISTAVTRVDLVANVFLFLPLGFLFRASRGGSMLSILALGFLLSAFVESLQLLSRGRYFSPFDLLTNTAGAGLGAAAYSAAKRRLKARLAGQLALELPLMNLAYLVVPLLWLDGLAAGRSAGRLWLSALLGVFGTTVLVSVWRHRLRPAGVLSPAGLGLAGAAWFLAAGLPGLHRRPLFLLAGVAGLGLLAWLLALRAGPPGPERRFEVPTLRRSAPLLAAYLVLLSLWPWTFRAVSWRAGVAFTDLRDEPGPLPLLRLAEALAAFTLLGYGVAEYRSRREERLAPAAAAAALACLAAAVTLESLRGFHPRHGASLLRAVLLALSGAAGAAIYVQLRDAVRRWLGSGEGAGA